MGLERNSSRALTYNIYIIPLSDDKNYITGHVLSTAATELTDYNRSGVGEDQSNLGLYFCTCCSCFLSNGILGLALRLPANTYISKCSFTDW